MENASKALIMGAEILIGVMVISVVVYIFSVLGQYSAETSEQIDNAKIQQFNEQFTKFYGTTSILDETGKIVNRTKKCTLQDVVSVANMANMYNKQNEFNEEIDVKNNSGLYYVQVDLKINAEKNIVHLERKQQSYLVDLLKDNGNYGINISTDVNEDLIANTKYFKVTEIKYSEITKRVNYIKFEYDENLI